MVSDDQIVNGCKKGKRRAFNQLYLKYAQTMLGICVRYTRNRDEAEDVLQEGFIKIFKKIGSFEGRGSFEGWLKRVMVNTAINYIKSNSKYLFQEEYDITNINHTKDQIDEVNIIETDVAFEPQELLKMVNELPDGYRLVFNMYVFDGLTHQEIADSVGIKVGTSKSQLSKARKYLREQVDQKQQKLVKA